MRRSRLRLIAVAVAASALLSPAAGAGDVSDTDDDVRLASGVDVASFHVLDDQMRGLIETALAENPRLASAWTRSRAALERVSQERSLPDPQLSYRYFAMSPETRVGPQEHALEYSQAVPWGGKRRLQGERAENLGASRTFEAEDLGRRLVADVKRMYFEAAYLQEALRVNEEEKEMLRRFESIALKRYATGQGIQQNVVKVQTEISRLDDRRTDLRRRLDLVTRRLAERVGRPEIPLVLDPIDLPFPEFVPGEAALEQEAAAAHPRVRAVERQVVADRSLAERRKIEARPDFRFGLGYTFVGERTDRAGRMNPPEGNGDDILGLTVGITIPLFRDRIHAGVAEARESERANRELLTAVQNELRSDVQQATVELDALRERGRLYREVIVPQAEESLASAEAAYTTDRMSFLDLLDAERVLFQSRLAYHRLVADQWVALADLELAAARPIPGPGAERDPDASTEGALP